MFLFIHYAPVKGMFLDVYWNIDLLLKICKIQFLPKASELLSWPCVRRPSVHPSVHPFVRVCVCKLLLQKTFPLKLLTGFLPNITGMFLRWSCFKFLQIIVFHEEFWLPKLASKPKNL